MDPWYWILTAILNAVLISLRDYSNRNVICIVYSNITVVGQGGLYCTAPRVYTMDQRMNIDGYILGIISVSIIMDR